MKRLPAVIAGLSVLTGIIAIGVPAQFRIEVAVDLVNVNFSAMDRKGRMIPGLTAEDFTIEEDGRKQTITAFARERELPLTLAMLVDVSPSVGPVFEEEKHTASGFFKSVIGPRDLALVITFDRWVTLVQDYTEHLPDLTEAIESLSLSKGGTSLFDAVYLAADEKLSREAGRKAIVLISDGEDTTSTYNASRALIAAHRSNAVIYSISNSGNSKTMRELAEDTGGAFFRIRREGDFQNVFDQISLELRTQYSIAYQSNNTVRDGGFRRIKIIPRDTNISVRARRGYYAPKEGERR
jgi:VWFA-related protein